jgi:hypothetical protein
MTFEEVEAALEAVMSRTAGVAERLALVMREMKAAAVTANDQATAKRLWCLEQTLRIQTVYLRAFDLMKASAYYDGWCTLEHAEIALLHLERHQTFDRFQLEFISNAVRRFQGIFPYKMFASPEFVLREVRCGVCDAIINIRKPCGHRVGEIYDGEMCDRVASDVEAVAMAMVEKPLQKYSVLFLTDPKTGKKVDHYNYTVIEYLIRRLASPFDGWDVTWTKRRHSHTRFRNIGRNDQCPCESGKKYKRCCLSEDGILRPHCAFTFHKLPPFDLLTTEYSY